jgi:NhaA family Na+:H+ antiporter
MRRLIRHAQQFMAMESAGGIAMIATAAFAVAFANSSLSAGYQALIAAPLFSHFHLGSFTKDVLMVIFFFAIGMELKREMREGALAEKGQKILPLIAALGGIVLPALLYLAITRNHPQLQSGWAIPTATDIAFAMCVLRLFGSAVPAAAKMFLLAIAIYDDLAAILIIAFFYSSGVALMPLVAVAALAGILYAMNRASIRHIAAYLVVGIALWFALEASGIHTTVAGVMVGIAIPMRTRADHSLLGHVLHRIHPWVAFAILPLFAFTSAGVDLRGIALDQAFSALPVGIALALFMGKQIGIFGATFAAVKLGVAPLPKAVNWPLVYGMSLLAGIGFTMSLFIGKLAFTDAALLDAVKIGVIAGSLLSTLAGALYLRAWRSR